MEQTNVYYDFKDVRERDMDFMMMEEFGASQEFANIFLCKVGKKDAKVVYIYHSKYEKYMGESDMVVICNYNGRRHALLIEDKIAAEAMPYQSSRYFKRGDEAIRKGEYESYDIFIVAPHGYLMTNGEASLYPNRVSYEEIERYMRQKNEEKYNFKLQMIEMALGREKAGYQRVEHVEVATFWDGYISSLHRNCPYIVCTNADMIHCGNSHWPYFKSPCAGTKLVHKAKQGYVDLQFGGMGDRLDILERKLAMVENKYGAYVAKASKSGSIRIDCPLLDFKKDYKSQAMAVEECMKAIGNMYKIAQEL